MKITTLQQTKVWVILVTLLVLANTSVWAQEPASTTYIQVRVDGLSCPFCAYGLEKKLKKLEGAKNLQISLENGMATFEVPTNKKPEKAKVEKIVTDAGFTPREIKFSSTPFKANEVPN